MHLFALQRRRLRVRHDAAGVRRSLGSRGLAVWRQQRRSIIPLGLELRVRRLGVPRGLGRNESWCRRAVPRRLRREGVRGRVAVGNLRACGGVVRLLLGAVQAGRGGRDGRDGAGGGELGRDLLDGGLPDVVAALGLDDEDDEERGGVCPDCARGESVDDSVEGEGETGGIMRDRRVVRLTDDPS